MKRRKLVKVERKPKYEEIEMELWECPKCEGILFGREYVFEFQKVKVRKRALENGRDGNRNLRVVFQEVFGH
jgi:hypothetical protein